jgi:glycosyltransferase involved in cell wall biosynthesis
MHIGPHPSAAPPTGRLTARHPTVCHVLAALPTLSETFVANEIRALRALGHVVVPVVLTADEGHMQPDDLPLRDEAIRLTEVETLSALTAAAANPAGLAAAVGFAQRQHGLPRRVLLRAAARLAYTVRARGCTHIHAPSAQAAAVAICGARIAGTTASFAAHGQAFGRDDADLGLTLAAADLVIAVSETSAVGFRRLAPHAKIHTIPIGIAPERFRPTAGPSNGRLLAIGQLVPQKGYRTLLAALARMQPARRPGIDVIGGGPLEAELVGLARGLGLGDRMRFLGPRPSDWIAAEAPHYQGLVAAGAIGADGGQDSATVAIKEAMAMGLPVVAASLPGVREVLDEGCGRLVAAEDPAALAEALAWLAGLDPAARIRLGAAGRARVQERFSLRQQAMRLAAAFAELHE